MLRADQPDTKLQAMPRVEVDQLSAPCLPRSGRANWFKGKSTANRGEKWSPKLPQIQERGENVPSQQLYNPIHQIYLVSCTYFVSTTSGISSLYMPRWTMMDMCHRMTRICGFARGPPRQSITCRCSRLRSSVHVGHSFWSVYVFWCFLLPFPNIAVPFVARYW